LSAQYNDLQGSPYVSETTTYALRSLQSGVTYRIAVSAVNGIGEGTISERIMVTTNPTTVNPSIAKPPQPVNLKVTAKSMNSFTIMWTPGTSTDANILPTTVYNIYFAERDALTDTYF
jgi:hypothetical protein